MKVIFLVSSFSNHSTFECRLLSHDLISSLMQFMLLAKLPLLNNDKLKVK
jgi:hypothetical protein